MVLVFDIGTSFIKGALVTAEGRMIARGQVPTRMIENPDPLRQECDANGWLSGMALVSAQLGLRDKGRIRAVVVSSNGPTLVPVDADCEPLGNAMTWMDRRAEQEAELIAEYSDAPVDASFYLPKVLWVRRHEPALYEKTRYFLPCAEFLTFFLTGSAYRIIPTELFKEFFWNEGAVSKLGLDPDKLAPFAEPGEWAGTVSYKAAETLGIPSGLPVIAGGPDYIMSILGTASVSPGRTCDRAGTSEGINLCWSSTARDRRLLCFPHVVPGMYNISAMLTTSGAALEWAARSFGSSKSDVESLFKEIQGVPPGASRLLFLPFLHQERFPVWDPHVKGAFLGLTIAHGRREMMRAVAESTAFAVRSVIRIMESDGCEVADLRVAGGQGRLDSWCQIRADVTGKRVLRPSYVEAELIGDACVGFLGLEDFENLKEASESLVRIEKTFSPNPELRQLYEDMGGIFEAACGQLGEVFRGLASAGQDPGPDHSPKGPAGA